MGTVKWTGASGDGAYGTVGNWDTGVAPVTGDAVIFDAGSYSLTGGLDQSAVDLLSLTVTPGYTGTIGISDGTPLKIGVSGTASIQPGAGGAVYLNSGATNDIANLFVQHSSAAGVVNIAGTIVSTVLRRGAVTVASGTLTTLWLNAFNGDSTALTVAFKGGTVTTTFGFGGNTSVTAATTLTTVNWDAGTLDNWFGAVTTYNIRRGGLVYHQMTGTVTLATIYPGGILDCTRDRRTKTFTNVTLHRQGQFSAGNATLTNGVKDPLGSASDVYGGGGVDEVP